MTEQRISINGCDDTTYVKLDLTDEEMVVIRKLAEAVRKAKVFGCQPSITTDISDNEYWPPDDYE